MPNSTINTVWLNDCLDRWRGGDLAGRDDLVQRAVSRLQPLTRKMLKSFPNVRRWEETGDVMQSALLRLLRSLEVMRPNSTRDFFNLAAVHIRRELLDLARHYRGTRAFARSPDGSESTVDQSPVEAAPAPPDDSEDLDRWCAFHEHVEQLPVDEREVIGLVYYHGWTQAEVAELFQISDRTVRRIWVSGLNRLREAIGITLDEGSPA